MFIHNFKYSLKTLFRNKELIFWTFAFPIILATFFNMAFSDIENSEKLDVINIAIIQNDDFDNNEVFKSAFEEMSDKNNKDRLFETKYTTKEEAQKLLEEEKIVGYMELVDNKPKLTFITSGINETIFKYVSEEIMQTSNIINNLTEEEIQNQIMTGNFNVDYESIYMRAENSSMYINQSKTRIKMEEVDTDFSFPTEDPSTPWKTVETDEDWQQYQEWCLSNFGGQLPSGDMTITFSAGAPYKETVTTILHKQ